MRIVDAVLRALLLGLVLRHGLVLRAVLRSHRFLQRGLARRDSAAALPGARPCFYIVLPVLREAAVIEQAVAHFETLAAGHDARIVVVTTAREELERDQHASADDTVLAAKELAASGRCTHLHYPDPQGVKADQLNFAVDYLAAAAPDPIAASRSFLLCYDADSRPPLDSLAGFQRAITQHPHVNVFHQSSRFELRQPDAPRSWSWPRCWLADAGALRANRFVVAYEIPRLLNRSPTAPAWRRRVASYVYAHVTGHGLCARLSLLQRLPFPPRSPLEDMHYSFILGSRNEAMLPIPSLDCAEVPSSVRLQIEQAARWFFGPGRFVAYRKHPQTRRGLRARLLSVSALAICVEWLSCAVMPVALVLSLWRASEFVRAVAVVFVSIYFLQLIATDRFIGSPARPLDRVGRLLAYPITCTLFGVGGIIGAGRLLQGGSGVGKTERSSA